MSWNRGRVALQVFHISPEAFYGVSDNSNGNTALSYYHYPPPALNSVGATVPGITFSPILDTDWCLYVHPLPT